MFSIFNFFYVCNNSNVEELKSLSIKKWIHDFGAVFFTGPDFIYLNRLFSRFCQNFGIKHVAICFLIAVLAYLILVLWQQRKSGFTGMRVAIINQKSIAAAFLAIYYYLLILYTIVFRPVYEKPQYRLQLFWSYQRAFHGSSYLFYEIILNYILLMPLGILLPVFQEKHSFRFTIFVGFFSSAIIECMQLFFRRGLFEFDDILGNVFGVVIGYGIRKVICYFIFKSSKYRSSK